MQVTLVQSEIEAALTDYVNNIMSVKEGMTINVTFKATRGEEGATAIIDILPIGDKQVVGEPVKKEVVAEPAKKVVSKAATTGQTTSTSGDDTPEPAKEEEAAEEPVVEDKPQSTGKPSLFGNLKNK